MLCCRRVDASVNGCRTGGRGFFSAFILVTGGTSWHFVSWDFLGCLGGCCFFAPGASRVSPRRATYFFCFAKKSKQKKASHVRAASRSLPLLAAFGTLANSLRSDNASVLIRTLLRCSARPNGGGIPHGSSASRTSRGLGCLIPHFSQGHGTPCPYDLTPHSSPLTPHSSLLTPHSS